MGENQQLGLEVSNSDIWPSWSTKEDVENER
jgi:hypothetical protein